MWASRNQTYRFHEQRLRQYLPACPHPSSSVACLPAIAGRSLPRCARALPAVRRLLDHRRHNHRNRVVSSLPPIACANRDTPRPAQCQIKQHRYPRALFWNARPNANSIPSIFLRRFQSLDTGCIHRKSSRCRSSALFEYACFLPGQEILWRHRWAMQMSHPAR